MRPWWINGSTIYLDGSFVFIHGSSVCMCHLPIHIIFLSYLSIVDLPIMDLNHCIQNFVSNLYIHIHLEIVSNGAHWSLRIQISASKPLYPNHCIQTFASKPLHPNHCIQTSASKPLHPKPAMDAYLSLNIQTSYDQICEASASLSSKTQLSRCSSKRHTLEVRKSKIFLLFACRSTNESPPLLRKMRLWRWKILFFFTPSPPLNRVLL